MRLAARDFDSTASILLLFLVGSSVLPADWVARGLEGLVVLGGLRMAAIRPSNLGGALPRSAWLRLG